MYKKIVFLILSVLIFSGCTNSQINKSIEVKEEGVISKVKKEVDVNFQKDHFYKFDGITRSLYLKTLSLTPNSRITDFIAVNNNDIMVSSLDKMIYEYDIKNKIKKNRFLGFITESSGEIENIALSPNKKYIAVSGNFLQTASNFDKLNEVEKFVNKKTVPIRIYDYKTGKLVVLLREHTKKINDIQFSEDSRFLISSSEDKRIISWKVNSFKYKNQERIKSFPLTLKYRNEMNYLKLRVKGKNVYALSEFNTVYLFKNYDEIYSEIAEVDVYHGNDFDVSKKHIAVIDSKKELNIHINNRKVVNSYVKNLLRKIQTISLSAEAEYVYYSKDEKYLLCIGKKGIEVFSVLDGYKKTGFININIDNPLGFLNKREFIYATKFNDLKSIDIFNLLQKELFSNNRKKIKEISFKSNTLFIEGSDNQNISFNLETKKVLNSDFPKIKRKTKLLIHQKYLDELSIIENGILITKIDVKKDLGRIYKSFNTYKDFVITGGEGGKLLVYHKYGYLVASLEGHSGTIENIVIDNNIMVSKSNDNIILFWDLSILDMADTYLYSLENAKIKPRNIDYAWTKVRDKKNTPLEFQLAIYDGIREDFINSGYYQKESTVYNRIYNYLGLTFTKDNEYILWNKDGYFTYEGNANKGLGYSLNNGISKESTFIEINKLYDTFYRPDLVSLSIEKKDINIFTKKTSFRTVLKNPPPKVAILNKSKTTRANKINIKFKVNQVDNGGIGLIRIYQEGKLVRTIGNGKVSRKAANVIEEIETEKLEEEAKTEQTKYLENIDLIASKSTEGTVNEKELIQEVPLNKTSNKEGVFNLELPLKAGKNSLEIEAFNKTNTVASIREKIQINAKIKKRKPTVYAIVAGVNEFEQNRRFKNLKYSQNDAKAIKKALETKIKEKVEVTYLIGKDLTKENLQKAVEKIKKKAKLEDKVIFYISTHGKAIKGNLYLIPQNNKQARNWIKFEELFKEIQSINALEQIFVVDACESGKAKDIVASIYDSKASVLAKSSGVHVLLATTKGTYAFEHSNPNVKHGVFTNNILKALNDKSTDKNRDRKISVIELSKTLKESKYTVKHQYPVIRNVGYDTKIRDLK